jgi:Tfp pilus assembly protein FimT
MKQTLKRIIRTVKSVKGNSLAEFATTTALMATLAATAAPKLSEMSEGAKAEKSRNELDKLVKQAGQFYQDTADIEGRGRFPGQDKFNRPVTGSTSTYNNDAANTTLSTQSAASQAHETKILYDLGLMQDNDADGNSTDDDGNGYTSFDDSPTTTWISVFGESNPDFPAPSGAASAIEDDGDNLSDCNTFSVVGQAKIGKSVLAL